jgi:hypothetical protein
MRNVGARVSYAAATHVSIFVTLAPGDCAVAVF